MNDIELKKYLREENRKMEMECFQPLINEAHAYEENGLIEDAIRRYLIAFEFAETQCNSLDFSDYLKCINPLILLYNDSGKYAEMRIFLSKVISKFTEYAEKGKKILSILDKNNK